jgi:hypothetical protein
MIEIFTYTIIPSKTLRTVKLPGGPRMSLSLPRRRYPLV